MKDNPLEKIKRANSVADKTQLKQRFVNEVAAAGRADSSRPRESHPIQMTMFLAGIMTV